MILGIIWQVIISILAAFFTAPIYHHLLFSWIYKDDKDGPSKAESVGYWILVIVLAVYYFLLIQYGSDSDSPEHYYPEQWEPAW